MSEPTKFIPVMQLPVGVRGPRDTLLLMANAEDIPPRWRKLAINAVELIDAASRPPCGGPTA